MRIPTPRRFFAAATLLAVLAAGAIAAPAASAASPVDAVVASGDGWTVERVPAGYRVVLRLDAPLPIVADAPTLIVDGTSIGAARTSDRGRTLTVVTADVGVASARSVQKGWASGSGRKTGETGAPEAADRRLAPSENDSLRRQLAALAPSEPIADPAEPGPYGVTEAEYDFGDHAIDLAGYPGTRGEVAGKLYLSAADGARPVVVLLHGRHATCGDPATEEATAVWPCPPGQMVVRSALGYEGTGRALASHGYDVVSISANGINATDAELSLDEGAQARGRLVLDTLGMLDALASGRPVSFQDRPGDGPAVTRSFDEALDRATVRDDQPAADSGLVAGDLVGRFDLSRVGLMGHSRGGEGVVAAAQLNAVSATPFGIQSVLPLAPTDFARRTLPDVTTTVVLPYCDGDVADQQGQRYIDDSRYAFDDDVLRSAVWVMGANHNFFSSVWTPGEYPVGTADDWRVDDDTSSCATTDPTRLSAAQQYQVGVSFMTGFFRLTLGGEQRFRPLVDGSIAPRTTATEFADIRVMANQPRSATDLVTDFAEVDEAFVVSGDGQIDRCESSGVWANGPCSYASDFQLPHWGQALLAPTVPTRPATRFTWSGADDDTPSDALLRVPVPEAQRDVSDRTQLTLKAVPGDGVVQGTDFSLTLVDGQGGAFTTAASALNPFAVNRMPDGSFLLGKHVLQQLTLPLSDVTGVDLTDVREIRIAPLVGADGTASGSVILSDLAFDEPSAGDPRVVTRTAVNMVPARVEARDEPWEAQVAVVLAAVSPAPVTAWVSALPAPGRWGSSASTGGVEVTFAPGETCVSVPVYLHGEPSLEPEDLSVVRTGVTTSRTVVTGSDDFSTLVVRGAEGAPQMDLPFGVQGDACAEYAASRMPGSLALSTTTPAAGETFQATATGFRAGEAVVVTLDDTVLEPVIADAEGTAVIETRADQAGTATLTATGAGSARVQTATLDVQAGGPAPSPTPTGTAAPTASPMPTATSVPTVGPDATAAPAGGGASSLARTGVDAMVWLTGALLGALLTAAGLGARGRARRRSVR